MQLANPAFKFRFVQNKQGMGFMSKKGSVTDTDIILDGETIPYRNIV